MTFVDSLRSRTALFSVCAACIVAPSVARGQVVEVHALKPGMQLPGQSKPGQIRDATISIKPDDSVVVRIVDNNPLLLNYSATVTKEESEQHKTVAAFLKELTGWLTNLGFKKPDVTGAGLTPAPPVETLIVEGVNFAAFQKRLTDLDTRLKSLPGKITDSTGDAAAVAELKKDVRAWNAARDAEAFATDYLNFLKIATKCLQGSLLETNQGDPKRCTDSVPLPDPPGSTSSTATASSTATRAGATEAASPSVTRTPASASDKTTPAAGTKPASSGSKGAQEDPPVPPGAVVPPAGAVPPSAPAGAMERGTIQSYVSLANSIRGQIMDSAKVLAGFAADVAKLHAGEDVATVDYLPTEDQKIAVKIAASDVYKAFLQDDAKAKRDRAVRSFVITVTPYSAATWTLGAAVVVPMISDPTFTAKKVGDKFVIDSTENDSQPYQVAAMLGIEPRRFRQQPFALGFQIGASPAKERIALYAGPHVRLYAVSIGGGLLLQRTTDLEGSLSPGQVIDAEADLKTNKKLRPGGYVQVSLNIFKK
jgi:hypothetical protein